ncbi:hypothetical protein B7463_g3582, partial [Scytalidium lignicola]
MYASTPASPSPTSPPEPAIAPPRRQRRRPNRQTWSCLPCRQHKLKCSRDTPCQNCIRYRRENLCQNHRSPVPVPVTAPGVPILPPCPVPRVDHNDSDTWPHSPSAGHPCTLANTSSELLDANPRGSSAGLQEGDTDLRSLIQQRVSHYSMLKATKMLRRQFLVSRASPSITGANGVSVGCIVTSPETPTQIGTFSHIGVDEASQWRLRLVDMLPTREQCDILVSYFSQHVNWIYNAIHKPSFQLCYAEFWSMHIDEIDLIWLSLLYAMLSVSVMCFPVNMAGITLGVSDTEALSRTWHLASRQCLYAGGFESEASFTQLQTFVVTQLYWHGINDSETLYSCLGQAIRAAQSLGLDKETTVSTSLDEEMRHRIWWELCSADISQSMFLGRQPFIQAHLSHVPLPLNCNDIDMAETNLSPRPLSEPTQASNNIFRSQAIKRFSKLYVDNGANLSAIEFIMNIDEEVLALLEQLPWYYQMNDGISPPDLPSKWDFITWQSHLFHTSIHDHRIRMYRPFLQTYEANILETCSKAAESALSVYRSLREMNDDTFTKLPRMAAQCWGILSTATTLALLLLVEQPHEPARIRKDAEMVITDLEAS